MEGDSTLSSSCQVRPFSETPDIFKQLPTASPASSFDGSGVGGDNNGIKPLDVTRDDVSLSHPSTSSFPCSLVSSSCSPASSSTSTSTFPHVVVPHHQPHHPRQNRLPHVTFARQQEEEKEQDVEEEEDDEEEKKRRKITSRESFPLTDVSALFNRMVPSSMDFSCNSSFFHPRSSCFEAPFDTTNNNTAMTAMSEMLPLHHNALQQPLYSHPPSSDFSSSSSHQYCSQELCSLFNRIHPIQQPFSSPSPSSCSSSMAPSSASFHTSALIPSSSFNPSLCNSTTCELFPSENSMHCIDHHHHQEDPYLNRDHPVFPSSIYCTSLGRLREEDGLTGETIVSSSHCLEGEKENESSLFGLKVHHEVTTDHELQHQEEKSGLDERDPWNQFQGSVVSSFGRKYLENQERKERRKRNNKEKGRKNKEIACKEKELKSSSCYKKKKKDKSHAGPGQLSSFVWKKVFPMRHEVFSTTDSPTTSPLPVDALAALPDHLHPPLVLATSSPSSFPASKNKKNKHLGSTRSSSGPVVQDSFSSSSSSSSIAVPAPNSVVASSSSSSSFQSKCLNRRLLCSTQFILSSLSFTACLFILVFAARLYIQDNHSRSAALTSSRGKTPVNAFRNKDNWWKESILYEIFPASFKDSDNDGFGDFQGIRSKISYLKDLGVTGIRLSSIFSALDYPYQFDHVIDFKDVDSKLGSLRDFELLLNDIHDHDMMLILDINPTITSDQHPWATSWLSNKSSPSDHSSLYVVNRNYVSHVSRDSHL